MMSVAIYTAAMQCVHENRAAARKLEKAAEALEDEILNCLGITCANREPGFPCWEIEGVSKYFNSPLEALEAKEKP